MNDKEQIENVVQLYVDSMDESNPDKVKQAFHINAKVVGYLHGDFMEMSADDFCFLDSLNSLTIDSMDRQVTNEEGNGTSISDLMCDEDANKTDYLLDEFDVKSIDTLKWGLNEKYRNKDE